MNTYSLGNMETMVRAALNEHANMFITSEDIRKALNDGYKEVAALALCCEREYVVYTISGSRLVPFKGHRVNYVSLTV